MKTAAVTLGLLALSACGLIVPPPQRFALSTEHEAELAEAMNTPTELDLPADEAAAAWGRAQVWVQRNSVMKIQTVSDYIIETYNLVCMDAAYRTTSGTRYTASRMQVTKDLVRITVAANSCYVGPEQTDRNLHLFAYWVKTGKLACTMPDGRSACLSQ